MARARKAGLSERGKAVDALGFLRCDALTNDALKKYGDDDHRVVRAAAKAALARLKRRSLWNELFADLRTSDPTRSWGLVNLA